MSALIPWVPAHGTSGQYYCREFFSLSLGGKYYYFKSQYLSLDVSTLPWDTVMAGTNTLVTIRGRNYYPVTQCLSLDVRTLFRALVPVTSDQHYCLDFQ